MHRFFVKDEYIENDVVEISGEDFNHISNSLRLQPGDEIIVSPGNSYDYIVELKDFNDKTVIGRIINKEVNQTEPEINVDLGQAIPKNRNIELVIQKGTEIGVNKIIPLDTERTIVKLSKSKEKRRLKRWQKISKEAAKQSQRGQIPNIKNIVNVNNKKEIDKLFSNYDIILVLYAKDDSYSIKQALKQYKYENIKNILVLIGPEGGFAKQEIIMFEKANKNNNVKTINLGTRILRTETAGLVALSSILYEFGDLGG
ncbi:MAG TPA: RsmE family RNA methyltransferase [Halanaerobiales bacterium]|nr:RsmE family RNA methyltransferase [Halanaerobiales bacterium]